MTAETYLWKALPSGYAPFYVAAEEPIEALTLAQEHSDHDIVGITRESKLVLRRSE